MAAGLNIFAWCFNLKHNSPSEASSKMTSPGPEFPKLNISAGGYSRICGFQCTYFDRVSVEKVNEVSHPLSIMQHLTDVRICFSDVC